MAAVPIDDMRKELEDLSSSSRRIINRTRDGLSDPDDTFIVPGAPSEPKTFFEDLSIMYQNERPKCKWTMHRDLLGRYAEKKDAECLVFNIFGEQKKFNVEVRQGMLTYFESAFAAYDDETVMDFLDKEEIPPIVVTHFTLPCEMKLFRDGGVISELRFFKYVDYMFRITSSFYLYLKLSTETKFDLLDLYALNPRRTPEQIRKVEANLILATSGPLCLDPSPEVSLVANHMNYEKKLLSHPALKRIAQRNLPEAKQKRRALNCIHTTPQIAAMRAMMRNNFFSDKPKDEEPKDEESTDEESMAEEPMEQKEEVKQKLTSNLSEAASSHLRFLHKKICRFPPLIRPLRKDGSVLRNEEEEFFKKYCLESIIDEEHRKSLESAVITITKNDADKLFRGTLTLSSESFIDPEARSKAVSRNFLLGTQDAVDKFVEQFIEVYTEAGCKPVVIQRSGPNEEIVTEYPPCMRARKDQKGAAKVVSVKPEPKY